MNNLENELRAAGFTPVPLDIEGVIAWTGWRPASEDVYERYYELLKAAMIAQVDRQADPGVLFLSSLYVPVLRTAARRELQAVVSAWRSAASIAPVC